LEISGINHLVHIALVFGAMRVGLVYPFLATGLREREAGVIPGCAELRGWLDKVL
jgi:hypothetical protein